MRGLKKLPLNRKSPRSVRDLGTEGKLRVSDEARRKLKEVEQAKADMEGRARRKRIG